MNKKRKQYLIQAILWTIIWIIWLLSIRYNSSSNIAVVITKHIATICSVITAGIYWFTFITDNKNKED